MVGMILYAGLALDQIGHPHGGPHGRVVAQSLGAFPQPVFDPLKLLRVEPGLAPSAPVLQRAQAALLDKGRPAGYRLAMHADAAGHLGLRKAFLQQPDPPQSARL